MLDQIVAYAQDFETLRKSLMGIAYRFLFDGAKPIEREKSLSQAIIQ